MTANSIGLSVAYFMQKTAVTFGGCTMGSEYLLITFEDLIDPLLCKLSLPTLKRKRYTNKLIHPQVRILSYLIIFQRTLLRSWFCRAPWSLLVSTAKWGASPLGRKVPSWGSYLPLLWWLRHAYRRMCLLLCLKMSELLSLLPLICCPLWRVCCLTIRSKKRFQDEPTNFLNCPVHSVVAVHGIAVTLENHQISHELHRLAIAYIQDLPSLPPYSTVTSLDLHLFNHISISPYFFVSFG